MMAQSQEEKRAREKAYRAANRERIAAQRKEYRAARQQETVAYRKAYRAANREKLAEIDKAFRAANVERLRAYRAARHEEQRIIVVNCRARKLGAIGSFTVEEWRAMQVWFGGVCLRCGAREQLSADHVVPLAKGGMNTIANIQPLCVPCNNYHKNSETTDYRDPAQLEAFLKSLTQE